jgi:hypothetical protein
VAAAPGPAGAAQFPGFSFHGGPVIRSPQVTTSFWGSLWSDDAHQQLAADLNQFHADLLQSDFMNVLSQYGVGTGAGSGAFLGATFISDVTDTLTDQGIQDVIQSAIDSGTLQEPSGPDHVLMIYLDETKEVNDPGAQLVLCEPENDTAFGYHNFFTTSAGNAFYYAVIPGLTDDCLSESCPGGDATCSLHLSQAREQRLTQVASHEFAEMTTDPQLNGWFDSQAGENGDICNGQTDQITVGGNTWNVQQTFSEVDDQSGGSFCLAQAVTPKPKLPDAP